MAYSPPYTVIDSDTGRAALETKVNGNFTDIYADVNAHDHSSGEGGELAVASLTRHGGVILASDADAITGTDTDKALTASNITAKIDTDGTLAGDLDTRIPSQKAVKTLITNGAIRTTTGEGARMEVGGGSWGVVSGNNTKAITFVTSFSSAPKVFFSIGNLGNPNVYSNVPYSSSLSNSGFTLNLILGGIGINETITYSWMAVGN